MMDKKIIAKNLLERYEALAATKSYIFGFVKDGIVYACRVENAEKLLPYIVIVGSASRGMGYSLRYNPNNAQKMMIIEASSEIKSICSFQFMEDNKGKYGNRGHFFEVVCAQAFGGIQNKKSNAKFTECGDITLNGKQYQVKFGCNQGAATFTNEATLSNLEHQILLFKEEEKRKKERFKIIEKL